MRKKKGGGVVWGWCGGGGVVGQMETDTTQNQINFFYHLRKNYTNHHINQFQKRNDTL